MSGTAHRMDRLRKKVHNSDCAAVLITNATNVSYLTGFTGDDSYLVVTAAQEVLLTDPRYTGQLAEECPGLELEVRVPGQSMVERLVKLLKRMHLSSLAVEGSSMSVNLFAALGSGLPKLQLVPTDGLVERLREVKDAGEIEQIRRAVECAERAMGVVRAGVRAERAERELAHELENQIRLFGGEGCSFPPIVAVGPRSALPHARPTFRRVGEYPHMLVDWGTRRAGYSSDLTRILLTGRISPKLQRVYEVVLNAQRRAIDRIKPGAASGDIDAAARTVIAKAGYGKYFGHGLGHGIGLEIHEGPRLAAGRSEPLRAGMVVTVEPGIYLPGWGGVRIEDDVLVTRSGHEVLSTLPKQLDECLVA